MYSNPVPGDEQEKALKDASMLGRIARGGGPRYRPPSIWLLMAVVLAGGWWSTACQPSRSGKSGGGATRAAEERAATPKIERRPPIRGVSFVAPRTRIDTAQVTSVRATRANWLAIVPYGFTYAGHTHLTFDTARQWWGETLDGAATQIRYAHTLGYKVMLKPQVWVIGQGWAGDYDLPTEQQWQAWERNYRRFAMAYGRLADSLEVELYCVGTEFRVPARERPAFWRGLIDSLRTFYTGELTYAANWDNFQQVDFWDALDYLGVDAYFPLTDTPDPRPRQLDSAWRPHREALADAHRQWRKPVLFTEYGYHSATGALRKPWAIDAGGASVDLSAQQKGLSALYRQFWPRPWFAGGFLWKWHAPYRQVGGPSDAGFTPQGKPALETVRRWYGAGPRQEKP